MRAEIRTAPILPTWRTRPSEVLDFQVRYSPASSSVKGGVSLGSLARTLVLSIIVAVCILFSFLMSLLVYTTRAGARVALVCCGVR